MAAFDRVQVEGLAEFRKDLRRVDPELAKQLGKAHKRLSGRVVDESLRRGRRVARNRWQQDQLRGIRPRGSQRRAQIALNTGRTPGLLALEFGTKSHRVFGRSVLASQMRRRVFPAWSGNRWIHEEGPAAGVGYIVQPTIREWVRSGRLVDEYWPSVEEALAVAFPE